MLSSAGYAPDTLANLEVDTFWARAFIGTDVATTHLGNICRLPGRAAIHLATSGSGMSSGSMGSGSTSSGSGGTGSGSAGTSSSGGTGSTGGAAGGR